TNPIWQALVNSGRHDFVPAELMVNTMNTLNDPRRPLYYQKATDGTYKGGLAGGGNSYGDVSQFSAAWQGTNFGDDMLDYSETEFLLAEAVERGFPVGGTAETHYDNAITASITFWGGSTTDASNYLAQPAVAYSSAAGDYKQKIGYQQWIAFANRGWDAWTSIRRLGYPNINVINPPVGAQGLLPLRYYYPLTEQSANANNWADAVKAMSGGVSDNVATKLFWMK
ncbi:MAG TPA: SusD/RagB family nutrient-binding outer membrane lipoprotein, partial [Puia sp.]|nr:SusD/RagB family nutrient-binding outer membrane lipoprotein [Puia sp.]